MHLNSLSVNFTVYLNAIIHYGLIKEELRNSQPRFFFYENKKIFLNYCHDNAFFGIIQETHLGEMSPGFFIFGGTYENSF